MSELNKIALIHLYSQGYRDEALTNFELSMQTPSIIFEQEKIERSCAKALIKKCGSTFPGATSWLPAVFEIDHILGRKIQFQLAKVIREGGSDHYPVYSTIFLALCSYFLLRIIG